MATQDTPAMDKLHSASCIVAVIAEAAAQEADMDTACLSGSLKVAEGLILEAMESIRQESPA